jgi:hypothetical protein
MVVEFRSASWWTERIAIPPRLRARAGPVKVVVDRPQRFGTNVPAVVASDLARLGDRAPARPQRRHLGQKGLTASSQRFNYDYSEAEPAKSRIRLRRSRARCPSPRIVSHGGLTHAFPAGEKGMMLRALAHRRRYVTMLESL